MYEEPYCRVTAAFVLDQVGDVLDTASAWSWFRRQHGRELIESGALLLRGGSAGSLAQPSVFRAKVLEILRRESIARAEAA